MFDLCVALRCKVTHAKPIYKQDGKKYKSVCNFTESCRILRLYHETTHLIMENPIAEWKARCAAAGTNLTQLCKRAGVARQTLEHWKKNPNPQAVTLKKLEDALAAISSERK